MTEWIVQTLIATTALMLVVLLIRRPVTRHFGARAAYLLWLAPALRMVMPPLPEDWGSSPAQPVQDAVIVMTGISSPSAITTAPENGIAWPILLGMIWLGGAALFLVRHIIAYRRFVENTLASAEPTNPVGRITVATSPVIRSPLALGIIGQTIIVPHDFATRFDMIEQRLAIQHELTHHRRGDPRVNLIALVMLAFHWFNPVAHIAYRLFRLDQEAACDAIVLEGTSPQERHAYGCALLKAATGSVPIAICAMAGATTLKTRLRHILALPESALRLRLGKFSAGLLVISGIGLTASGSVAAPEINQLAIPRMITAASTPGKATNKANKEAEEALAEAEAAMEAAERTAEAANEAADKASWDAKTAAQQARADVSRARADLARAEADRARAAADLARAEVEVSNRVEEIESEMPEPPEPPMPPAAAIPPAPPSPSVDDNQSANVQCPETTKRQVLRMNVPDSRGKTESRSFVICSPSASAIRRKVAEAMRASQLAMADQKFATLERERALARVDQTAMLSALERARESIANMANLSSEARTRALSELDEQLKRFRSQKPPIR